MFADIYHAQLEAKVRDDGPLGLVRDCLQTICKLRHEVDPNASWEYVGLIRELQVLVQVHEGAKGLNEGANRRAA